MAELEHFAVLVLLPALLAHSPVPVFPLALLAHSPVPVFPLALLPHFPAPVSPEAHLSLDVFHSFHRIVHHPRSLFRNLDKT